MIGSDPVVGHGIEFSVTGGPASKGSISPPPSDVTNANGEAHTEYTSGSNGGTVTVTARDTNQSGQPTANCTVEVIKILTQTVTTTPSNRDRTDLGIGEPVNCSTEGGIAANWEVSGGGFVYPTIGVASTTYYSPQSPATPTLHAKKDTADCSKALSVVAPDGLTSALVADFPEGTAGPPNNQIGARSAFIMTVYPTTVCFAWASLRENIPGQSWTWPDGADLDVNAYTHEWATSVANTGVDVVTTGLNPISRLWDGQTYTDFNYQVSVPQEYENDASQWVSWYPGETHPREYRGADQAARVEFVADNTATGGWEGPFQ